MNLLHPIREYRERKQKRLEEISKATNELLPMVNDSKKAEYLAPTLIKFRREHPGREYEIFMGTEGELKEKGYENARFYTVVGQRFVAKGMTSEQIWELQKEDRYPFRDLNETSREYEEAIEALYLARDKYEPVFGVIVPKDKEEDNIIPTIISAEVIEPKNN